MKATLLSIGVSALLGVAALQVMATEPEWGPSRVKDCDRECLVGFMGEHRADGRRRRHAMAIQSGIDIVQNLHRRSGDGPSGIAGPAPDSGTKRAGERAPESGSRKDFSDRAAL